MRKQHYPGKIPLRHRLCALAALLWLATMSWAQTAGVVSEIVVSGNKNITSDAILSTMITKVGRPLQQTQLDQDKDSIEHMGFFQAVDVRARELGGGNWVVTVEVSEFPKVKEIRVTGNVSISTDAILKVITVKPGSVFNANSVASSTAAIRKLYSDKGFFVAGFEQFGPSINSPGTVQISIVELTVHSVKFVGNMKTKPKVLDRLVKTRQGEAYNENKWRKDVVRVHNTQWFEEVKSSETMAEEGGLDLGLDVKEGRTGNFNIGAQLDPRVGLAGFVRIGEPNFQGTGQDVSLTFMQATTSTGSNGGASVDLSYTNPFYDARDTSLNLQVYSRLLYRFAGQTFGSSSPTSSFDQYNERHTGASFSLTRPFSSGDFYGTIGGRVEDIVTGSLSSTTSSDFIQQDGTLATITLGTVMNRRDVDVDTSRGDWMRLAVEPGFADITTVGGLFPSPSLLGTSFFTKGTAEYRHYWSSGPPRGRDLEAPRKVLALRLKYGAISGKVPFFEQFFAGGADTVRGYDEDRYWGKYTFVGTLEYRYPIQKGFNLIPFVDYGGAWGGYGGINTYMQTAGADLHLGYGLGLSFKTPFGAIRIDFGDGDNGFHTYFRIAPPF